MHGHTVPVTLPGDAQHCENNSAIPIQKLTAMNVRSTTNTKPHRISTCPRMHLLKAATQCVHDMYIKYSCTPLAIQSVSERFLRNSISSNTHDYRVVSKLKYRVRVQKMRSNVVLPVVTPITVRLCDATC